MDTYKTKKHAVYKLTYHVIFVTKYRKPVISDEIGDFMKAVAERQLRIAGGELLSAETDKDHIHTAHACRVESGHETDCRCRKEAVALPA